MPGIDDRQTVNKYQIASRVATAAVIAGGVTAAIAAPVHTELTLLSAEGPLWGSQTAIIVGGTTEPTPSTAFAHSAEDLYLHPLGFDGGATDSAICDMTGTDPCSAPLQVLTTPELIPQGQSTMTAAAEITAAVQNELAEHPGTIDAEHPLTVFAYSQGAAAASMSMTQLEHDGVPAKDVHFVFIGDPDTPGGAWVHLEPDLTKLLGADDAHWLLHFLGFDGILNFVTPDDLYPTTVYTLDTGGIADFEKDFQAGGIWDSIGHFAAQHLEYMGLTPEQIADATTTVDGQVTYIDMSDNINNLDAWLGGVLVGGEADSGLLDSVLGSVGWALQNWL